MDTIYDAGGRPHAPDTGPGQFADTRDPQARQVWLAVGLFALGLMLLLLMALIAASTRVQTAQVQRRDLVVWQSLTVTAVAPPNNYAVINCHCTAPVSRVFTSVGATVHPGDALVELSHPTAQAAYAAAREELAAAQQAYDSQRNEYAAQVRQAQQELAQAVEAQSALSSQPVQTPTGLIHRVPSPSGASDVTRPGNVLLPQASVTADEARARLTDAQQHMQEVLVPFQQRLAAARRSYQEASRGLSASFIRAPITGQVLELKARPGQPLSSVPNTLLATIADLSAVTIHAPLLTPEQEGIKAGMPVQVRVAQFPDQPLAGTVQHLTTELGPEVAGQPRQLRRVAVITFVNNSGLVKPDMAADVLVQTAALPAALCVPNGAIERDRDGQPFVRVQKNRRWVVVPVRLGSSNGAQTAVLSGLQEGQIVQLHPRRTLPAPV